MEREVKVGNTTFIIRSFSSESAKDTLEELLKKVIVKNAEKEFKKGGFSANYPQENFS